MRKNVLKSRSVESIKPNPDRRIEVPDGIVPGLYIVVQPGGKKSWALRYRYHGKPAKLTLGRYPAIGLADARGKARAELEKLDLGVDIRKAKIAAKTLAVSLPGTVADLCDRYVDQFLKKNVRRWKSAEGEIENHIKPHLGTLGLDEIERAHVRIMLSALEAEFPVAANRALQRIRAVFNWGFERDLVKTNPTLGLKKPTKEKPRSRTLSDEELAAVWKACDVLGYPAQQFMRILILTGQRRDDVRHMHWSELDLDSGDWTIPAERYKSDRPHLIPLTRVMVKMLQDMPFRDRAGYVFSPSGGVKPYGNVVRPKATLDIASGVTGWTLHDFRRTLRTGLSRLGIRPDISERVIGHAVGGSLGQTYDTHEFRSEKLNALEAWAAHVLVVLEGKGADNVVALRAARQ